MRTLGTFFTIETNAKKASTDVLEQISKALNVPLWMLIMFGSSEEDLGPTIAPLAAEMLRTLTNPST